MLSSKNVKKLETALAHDFLSVEGGAEKALIALHEIWPDSPVYTANYYSDRFSPPISKWDIRTSWVSRLPFQNLFEDHYKMFYQGAMETFDLGKFDLVWSVTFAGYAKGIIVKPESRHFCYVCTVPRFLWGLPTSKHHRLPWIYRSVILPPLEHKWRIWDRMTAKRPDRLIAISKVVQERIWKFYRVKSDVIYPPVETSRFERLPVSDEGHFVHWGRLEDYKRVDIIIEACVKARKKLKIIGTGEAEARLKELTSKISGGKYVEFLGKLDDKARDKTISTASAVTFACPDEDFGIVPVEGMSAGKPVIAFALGGVVETVIDGKTGVLVKDFSVGAYSDTIRTFNSDKFNSYICRARAREFSKDNFQQKITDYVARNFEENN